MNMRFSSIIACTVCAINLFAAGNSLAQDSPPTSVIPPRPIAWLEISGTNPTDQIRRLPGLLQAVEATTLSFEVTGIIKTANVELGDSVTRGETLATLDTRTFKINEAGRIAALQEARARLTEAKLAHDRAKKLVRTGAQSKAAFDNAKANYEAALSTIDVAKAELELAREQLSDTRLKAPYDGIITARHIEPSQQIQAGQAVFEIEGQAGLESTVMVPETIIQEIQPAQQVNIHFPTLIELMIKGEVTEISTRAQAANSFLVTVRLMENSALLRSGMTTEVDFYLPTRLPDGSSAPNIVTLPVTAILAGEEQNRYAFVYDADTSTVRKTVILTLGVRDNQVLVTGGLNPGDIVARSGVTYLYDGQPVVLLNAEARHF